MNLIDIVNERFKHGTPRSDAYKAGFTYGVGRKMFDEPKKNNPFAIGIAEADAWIAGNREGRDHAYRLIADNRG